MKQTTLFISLFAPLLLATTAAWASAEPGQNAPTFSVKDINGKDVSLAQFKGKTVVLEWSNPNCPFVKKHYDSGNMQALQKDTDADAVWITVNSTNAKHSDYMDGKALAAWVAQGKATPDFYLADASGAMGKAYGAKTTPHMFVIDPAGKVVYNGAIDDKRSANPADVKGAQNYVRVALDAVKSGKPVATASTSPYGCSVKY
jgi:peroxiredoxin